MFRSYLFFKKKKKGIYGSFEASKLKGLTFLRENKEEIIYVVLTTVFILSSHHIFLYLIPIVPIHFHIFLVSFIFYDF